MLAIIVTIRIDRANAAIVEERFAQFAKSVRADEPGTLAYHLAREPGEVGAYRVIEVYQDEEALERHKTTEQFKAWRPMLGAMLLSPPEVERLDVAV